MSLSDVLDADFRLFPYEHQLREFEGHCRDPARAFLWQMRTGKSKESIDQVCFQMAFMDVDAVILLAPNGVHRNWIERELPIHHWRSVPHQVFCWDTLLGGRTRHRSEREVDEQAAYYDRIKTLLKSPVPTWWAFASETVTRDEVRKVVARILRWKKRVALIVDESDDYGHAGSKKTSMVRALAKKCFMRRILSGTVIENSPLRAFSQFELLQPGALGHTKYGTFKARHAYYENTTTRGGRTYPKLVDYLHLDELRDNMAKWSSVVLREDVNLPPLRTIPRHFEMSEQQKAVYRDIKATFYTDSLGDDRVGVNEFASRMVKLQQISSGYMIDKWGDHHRIKGPNPRLEATLDEVELAGGRAVVWCAFQPEMSLVANALRKRGHKVIGYHGKSPESEKAEARKVMAPGSDAPPTVVVGHPKSGGRGLNFSQANAIIHHSHVMDAVVRSQSDERATEMGGDSIRVVNVRGSATDTYILDVLLAGKVSLAEDVARSGLKRVLDAI